MYVGECFMNPSRQPVRIWCAEVLLENCRVALTFDPRSTCHTHAVHGDPYVVGRLWIAMGDSEGECHLAHTDGGFSSVGFSDLAASAGIGGLGLSAFAERVGIPCLRVQDHNDADAVAALEAMHPDVVAFTGGGMIRQPLLDVSGAGIFNTHMGILPEYRGIDVVADPHA
jgi:hypothetical protein